MASDSKPIVFYDIKTAPPVEKTCCSPNPWKARLALNFKGVPYKTQWTPLPDVASTRKALNVPAVRKFADGSDFYTLPVIHDTATETKVGDSFDIAVYLQRTYPDSGSGNLFPDQKLDYHLPEKLPILVPLSDVRDSPYPEYANFNQTVDAAFTAHVQLTTFGFPFDPEVADICKAEFVRRASIAGITSWDQFKLEGQGRQNCFKSFEGMLGGLADLYKKNGGPFLLGEKACYADIIVGGWIKMYQRCLPKEEWEQVAGWHDGTFGKLADALEQFSQVK